MKPACYIRTRDNKIDWAEDCVSEDDHSLRGTYPRDEGYDVIPLYALPKGWQLVPLEPTEAMLRPFYECPPDELRLAWMAAMKIVLATVPVVERSEPLEIGGGQR